METGHHITALCTALPTLGSKCTSVQPQVVVLAGGALVHVVLLAAAAVLNQSVSMSDRHGDSLPMLRSLSARDLFPRHVCVRMGMESCVCVCVKTWLGWLSFLCRCQRSPDWPCIEPPLG